MCSGFKCVDQHYYVLINELYTKMSRVTLSLCYCVLSLKSSLAITTTIITSHISVFIIVVIDIIVVIMLLCLSPPPSFFLSQPKPSKQIAAHLESASA